MRSSKPFKNSTWLYLSLLGWTALLNSCTTVTIKEVDFYTDRGPDGAVITHFYSPDISSISKAAWDSIREGMVCTSFDAIGSIKAEIEQLCSKVTCDQAGALSVPAPLTVSELAEIRKDLATIKIALARLQ